MKIAFLNIYNGVIDRGAETFVKEVAGRLAKWHEVSVFQSGEPTGKETYKVEHLPVNWDWNQKGGAGTLMGFLFLDYWNRQIFLFSLRAFSGILKKRYDIVIPVNGGWLPAWMRLVTWLYGGKMVISGQSGIGWDDRNNLWCFPNVFVALSSKAEKWAKRANPFVKTQYIPNGTNLSLFKKEGSRFQLSLERPRILCVGALTPSKRIELAIKATAKLKNASLLIVGDGGLREELTSIGKRLLGKRFMLTKLPYADMPMVYRSADVFTIPSESNYSFEIVLVEAMANGLPVVANNDEIREEIVGDAGLLVDPSDTENYANALKVALDRDWGDKPRRQATKFDWDKIAKEYENIFKSLIH